MTLRQLRAVCSAVLPPLILLVCGWLTCPTVAEQNTIAVELPRVTEQMRDYSYIRYGLYFVAVIYQCAVQIFLMQSGCSSALRDWAETKTSTGVGRFLLYFSGIFSIVALAALPFSFFTGFVIEHHFHLTHQTFADWGLDQLKHFALGFLLALPAVGAWFWLIFKFPKIWAIVFAIVSSLLIGIEMFISPMVLEPVLNKFTPLESGSLRNRIEQLAVKAGAYTAPILVADKSRQTDKYNAYVSGLAGSTHIVIWDTMLKKMPEDQILAIVGHELGHYHYKHTLVDFTLVVLLNFCAIPINMFVAPAWAKRLPAKWGVRGLQDFAILPVLSLVMLIAGFFADPVINAWSRMQEHDADAYSLEVTGDRSALARSFVSLANQNLSLPDPPPFIKFWLFSHPTLKERIEFALGRSTQ